MVYAIHLATCGPAIAGPALPEDQDPSGTLSALLGPQESKIDLTLSKLIVDSLVDKDAEIDNIRGKIDVLAETAQELVGPDASDADKVAALRSVIYTPGPWNAQSAFDYDFDNPNGRDAEDQTLAQYLETKRGNCVNMPILFLAVAEQMDIEMNITTAPQHVFLQFENDETSELQHLEATSGAWPQRIVWQRQVLPMTDRAIESGMYMKRLTPREQVSVMGEILLHKLQQKGDQKERVEVAEVMLDVFPQNDIALLHAQDAYARLIASEYEAKYPSIEAIPDDKREQFDHWSERFYETRTSLDTLGWQPRVQTDQVALPGEGKPD